MPASAPLPRKCGRRALFAWDGQPWSCRRSTGDSVALCEDWRAFSTGSRVASPAALAAIRSLICRRWLFQVVGSPRQSEPVRRLAAVPRNAGESLVKAAGLSSFSALTISRRPSYVSTAGLHPAASSLPVSTINSPLNRDQRSVRPITISAFGGVRQPLRGDPIDLIELGIIRVGNSTVGQRCQVNDDVHTLQKWIPVDRIYEIRNDDGLDRVRKRYRSARRRPHRVTGANQRGRPTKPEAPVTKTRFVFMAPYSVPSPNRKRSRVNG